MEERNVQTPSRKVIPMHYMQTRILNPLSNYPELLFGEKLREKLIQTGGLPEIHEIYVRHVGGDALDVKVSYFVDDSENIDALRAATAEKLEKTAIDTLTEMLPSMNISDKPRYFQSYNPADKVPVA